MSHKQRNRSRQERQRQMQPLQPERPVTALVDIVMSVYGEWTLAERALDCLPQAAEGLAEGYRVIVYDNGTPPWTNSEGASVSPDQQAIAVKERLRKNDLYMRLPENVGFPAVYNKMVARGNSPLILILTADVFLFPGALTRMVRALDDPQVGVVGPLLIFPEGTKAGPANRVQHAGISFDIRGNPIHQFIGWSPDNPRVLRGTDVAAVTGACFLTRRSLWTRIGGFYEGYGHGTYEDVDYCFGVRGGGAKVIYLPEAKGYHVVGGSYQSGANRRQFDLAVNQAIFKGRYPQMIVWDEWRRV